MRIITNAVKRWPKAVVCNRLLSVNLSDNIVNELILPEYAYPNATPQKIADCPSNIFHPLFFPFFINAFTIRNMVISINIPSSNNINKSVDSTKIGFLLHALSRCQEIVMIINKRNLSAFAPLKPKLLRALDVNLSNKYATNPIDIAYKIHNKLNIIR